MWVFIFGAIANVPIGLPDLLEVAWQTLPLKTVGGIIYILIFATLAAYMLNAWALQRVPASSVGIYIYLQPVLVTIFSFLIFKDGIDIEKIGYMIFVFIGVAGVTYVKKTT